MLINEQLWSLDDVILFDVVTYLYDGDIINTW